MKNLFTRRIFLQSSFVTGLVSTVKPSEIRAEKIEIPTKLTFLFQGDSITDGNRGRNTDPNHIMGHGYAYGVASRIGADFPEAGFTFYNRGISGNRIPDLQKRWKQDTLDLKPDVLSLLIGINDVNAVFAKPNESLNVAQFEIGYRDLLDQCKESNPTIIFVLGVPFVYPIRAKKDNYEAWQKETNERAEVVKKLAKEYDAVLIDYPAMFDKAFKKAEGEYWIWDGVHPTVFGHELMAREWIKEASSKMKFLKKYKY
ncbi:SGNH/GDSL hydrolase family protein [Arcicella aquatica]|uniref:SGNH/GDSL hydrolase family protein n=1 Tax=Arcicella aquatica TaxID=217141 RepID=A0ABU5QJP1_9BACT|nr:SGNH/GDSL hydrolase family protein [Arcicella aquatica]MEA5257282.1 SGNH/GDSL hydrolase family protein [Arcicella aquatica]